MKSITFHFNADGKILVLPGEPVAEDQRLDFSELERVRNCLHNIMYNPEFYPITATDFKAKTIEQETEEFIKLTEINVGDQPGAGSTTIKTEYSGDITLEDKDKAKNGEQTLRDEQAVRDVKAEQAGKETVNPIKSDFQMHRRRM